MDSVLHSFFMTAIPCFIGFIFICVICGICSRRLNRKNWTALQNANHSTIVNPTNLPVVSGAAQTSHFHEIPEGPAAYPIDNPPPYSTGAASNQEIVSGLYKPPPYFNSGFNESHTDNALYHKNLSHVPAMTQVHYGGAGHNMNGQNNYQCAYQHSVTAGNTHSNYVAASAPDSHTVQSHNHHAS